MKNRRQSKLAKSAKKAAVVQDDSPDKFAKFSNKDKDLKQSKINKKVNWADKAAIDPETKRARITTNVKDTPGRDSSKSCDKITKQSASTCAKTPQTSKLSKTLKTKNQPTNEIAEEEKTIDVQTYLDTLPSEEIRTFIKGLIAEDKFNMLPVNTSAIIGNMEMMETYFKKNAETGKSKYDPNGRCLDGGTPLHAAIKAKNKQSVKLLLQNGADCSLVDFMGDNAIMAAIKAGDATVINTLWPYCGSLNVDHSNMLGMTALHLAAERSWEACTSFLLQNRASPNLGNGSGVTPLMIAASKGDLKVVECLVRGGADVIAEDQEYNTCICRAFAEKHQKVVDFLLRQIDGDKIVIFIRDLMDNVMHPPLPEKDYALLEQRYLPLLVECTRYGSFRYAFYSTNVVHKITVKLEDSLRDIEGSIQIANLLLCTFFKFGNELDKYFVKQFLKCKGPDLIIHMVHFYTNDWKISEKDSIFVFLPMIGLVELPEGRAWLSKNVLSISEYFNLFEKEQLKVYISHSNHHQWCLEQTFFKEINRVWIAFYNEIQKEQTFQREKHMTELLAQEDKEREQKERKLEKMKQKQHEKVEASLIDLWTVQSDEEQDKGGSNLNANSSRNGLDEWGYIGKVSKQNGEVTSVVKKSPTKDTQSMKELLNTFDPIKDKTWTTVCTKKQKEKQTKSKPNHKQDKKRKKESKFPLDNLMNQTPVKFTGSARWADVAKGIKKKPTTPNVDTITQVPTKQQATVSNVATTFASTFGQTDFPSLDGSPRRPNKQDKPKTMTFHFHGDSELVNTTEADYFTDLTIDADQIEKELEATMKYEMDNFSTDSDANETDTIDGCCFVNQKYLEQNTAADHAPANSIIGNFAMVNEGRSILGQSSNNHKNEVNNRVHDMGNVKSDPGALNISNGLEKLSIIGHIPENNGDITKCLLQEQTQYQLEETMPEDHTSPSTQRNYIRKTESKNTAVVSINDGIFVDTDTEIYDSPDNFFNNDTLVESIEDQIQMLISCGVLNHIEAKVYQNQLETYTEFEEKLNEYESDPFMDLSEAIEYLREDEVLEEAKICEIDDMFGSPGQIPESLEEESEEVMHGELLEPQPHIMDKTKVILSANFVQMQPSAEQANAMRSFANTQPCNLTQSPSRALVASDPAIIHCVNMQLNSQQNHSEADPCTDVQQNTAQNSHAGFSNDNAYTEEFVPTVGSDGDVDKVTDEDDLDLESIQKQTAVITPLKNLDGSLYPSVNCQLGNEILRSACQLAHQSNNDADENPDELDGEIIEAGAGNKKVAIDTKDQYEFPNFHADTKLSGHYNSSDISVAHRMQQVQHQQLSNYYRENKNKICDVNSWQHSKFTYYAQAADMDKDTINRHLEGHQETRNPRNVIEQNNTLVQPDGNNGDVNKHKQMRRRSSHVEVIQHPGFGYRNTAVPVAGYQHVPLNVQTGQQFNIQQQQQQPQPRVGLIQTAPVALFPVMPYRLAGPVYQPPPTHPANIRNIQTQQAAMCKTVKDKIDDILTSMFNAKIKSVRWRQELDKLRTLTPQRLQIIGKIIIPKHESDRQYVSYHNTGSTILGYLLDGSEVAVKITNCLYRPFKPEDINRLLSMETACHQFVNKYRAIDVHDGFFYIATDLFEYTLPEYLCKMPKQSTSELDLGHVKMVFQLLRGISTLHQQYLIVHAELRPDNILIDLDGNLKIGGYGFGRNVDRGSQFFEYNDEDKCWLAPEILVHKQKISFKSDIWTIGMLIYYIFKEGQNPFGSEVHEIICNISDQSYKQEKIGEEPDHLIGTMLSLNRTERPAVSEALKHPLFWADEKRMRLINIVGSDVVRELRERTPDYSSGTMLSNITRTPCSLGIVRWMQDIDPIVLREMKSFRNYKNNFIDLIVFVFNCCNHFDTLSSKVREVIDEPCHYFLNKFPSMLMTIHRAIKSSEKKDKPCYKPFF